MRKPAALAFALPSITIRRTHSDYPTTSTTPSDEPQVDKPKRVFVALGSNIGDRIGNITRAVDDLGENGVKVIKTSRLYESEPMYVEDQDRFINGVIEVSPLVRLPRENRLEVGIDGHVPTGPTSCFEKDREVYWTDEDVSQWTQGGRFGSTCIRR